MSNEIQKLETKKEFVDAIQNESDPIKAIGIFGELLRKDLTTEFERVKNSSYIPEHEKYFRLNIISKFNKHIKGRIMEIR